MKKIFRIGSSLFVYSIIPILSWILLSYINADKRIANTFSIIYSIQYIWKILKDFFGSGANIKKEKEKDTNSVWNSIFWGVIFSVIIFSLLVIFSENYITFYGQEISFYKNYVVYGILLIFLQTLLSIILEKLYFEDKEKLANLHLLSFNLINFIVLIGLSLLIKNSILPLILTLIILFIYVLILYINQFEKFKIRFNFFKNFRYESESIVSSILMLLIYFFGFKAIFSYGEEYLLAINIVALCTDSQWDSLEAIVVVAKVDISKNRLNYKKLIKDSYLYTFILILSSIIMTMILSLINGLVIKLVLIYLSLQILNMLVYTYRIILSKFTQLEYSPTLNTTISILIEILRTILSIFILSPFCTDLAQLIGGIVSFLIYLILRKIKYKLDDNTLTIKQNNFNNIKN